MTTALGLVAVLLLIAGTGYFVAQEFAFVAADRGVLREQENAGDAAAKRALQVTARLSFMLSGAQLGITVTSLLVGFIAQPALADVIAPWLSAAGLPESLVPGAALALGITVATIVGMILGELAPKNLGIARPEAVAKLLSRSTLVYLAVAGPVIRFFDSSATRLLRLFGVEPIEEVEQGATPEELDRIIEESKRSGELPAGLSELLDRALDFGNRTAEDVMVRRTAVVSLQANRPVSDLVDALRDAGHSRYPVLGEGSDDVVGVAGIRELLTVADTGRTSIREIVRPAFMVPAALPLPALLSQMRSTHEEFACVIDEYGGLAGVVTLEDLAEELVGELVDENDPEPPGAFRCLDGSWIVPGTLRIDEAERATGVGLPESEGYETVAGLVLAALGRLAEPGDTVQVPLPPDLDLMNRPEPREAELVVTAVHRRVPSSVRLTLRNAVPQTAESRS
ncbi:hemolysin family protein [Rhizohabitans arisaemae]|uniref:hemolysin family protein n=1 Tax=Rhizohabitans arisaemae TaxID=2720610 RepID=UPI0024B1A368|nr:hemolysin family protein [Rhizohabitans arisaemae]